MQTARLVVNNAKIGQQWQYDVNVSLVQTYDRTVLPTDDNGQIAYRSKETALAGKAETKDPGFSTTIKLKKGTTKIYTTQTKVKAATVMLDADAVCTDVEVSDITCEEGQIDAEIVDGSLFIEAPKGTQLGKHTLELTPVGSETMYRPKATLDITVIKGIETLDIKIPSTRLYKPGNKAANLKATVIYNAEDSSASTKKVTWRIVDEGGGTIDTSKDSEDELKNITINNGTVNVKKTLDTTDTDYAFRIEASAADFDGNKVTALSDVITVTSEPLELGGLMIVQKGSDDVYTVVAENGSEITTGVLRGARLVALRSDYKGEVKLGNRYTEEELSQIQVSASELSVKSSAAKAIALTRDEDGILITAGKPAKNIKLTVSTNDGGKKNAVMQLTVAYTKPKELRLSVAQNDRTLLNPYTQNGYEAEETQAAYYGTVNTILTVNVIYTQDNQSWSDLTGYGYTDHTLKISGGKILSSDIGAGQYQMIVTGKSATLTLLDNANNKKQHVYTINNEEYSAEKAPKVQPAGKTKTLSVGTLREAVMTYSVE